MLTRRGLFGCLSRLALLASAGVCSSGFAAQTLPLELMHEVEGGAVRDVGFFDHDGTKYYWLASVHVGARVYTYDEASGSFELFQELRPGDEVSDLELFTIGTDLHVALAHEANGADTVVDSHIYRLTGAPPSFESIQAITTMHAVRWSHFTIGADHYLAVANAVDNSTYDVMSRIYRYDAGADRFLLFQEIPTQGGADLEPVEADGRLFLAVANSGSGSRVGPLDYDIDSVIYEWDPAAGTEGLFVEHQRIPTHTASDWEAMLLDGETYLFVSNTATEAEGPYDYNTTSRLYRWDADSGASGQFVESQSIDTHGVKRSHAFQEGGVPYLAVPNQYDGSASSLDSIVYRWDGARFVEEKALPTVGGYHFASTQLEGRTLLATGQYYSSITSYRGPQRIYTIRESVEEKIVWTSYRSGNRDIWIMNPDGTDQQALTTNPADDTSGMLSPDGRSLVFQSRRSGALELWILDPALPEGPDNVRQLTSDGLEAHGAVWAADSETIYYTQKDPDDGQWYIWRIRADGTGAQPIINPDTSTGLLGYGNGIDRASTRLVHLPQPTSNPNTYDVWVADVGIWAPTNVSSLAALTGYERSDNKHPISLGGWILFTAQEPTWRNTSDYQIWKVNADDGSSEAVLPLSGSRLGEPGWSPDEAKIVFSGRIGTSDANIWVMDASGENRVALTTDPAQDVTPCWGFRRTDLTPSPTLRFEWQDCPDPAPAPPGGTWAGTATASLDTIANPAAQGVAEWEVALRASGGLRIVGLSLDGTDAGALLGGGEPESLGICADGSGAWCRVVLEEGTRLELEEEGTATILRVDVERDSPPSGCASASLEYVTELACAGAPDVSSGVRWDGSLLIVPSEACELEVCGPTGFVRGDPNDDGRMDLSDAVYTLLYLFSGGETPGCAAAADVDDSGTLTITDAVSTLGIAFLGSPPPPAPYPSCGADPTPDDLGCELYESCPE